MRTKLLSLLLLLTLLISCNIELQPTRLDREQVKEKSVVLSITSTDDKATLSILPSSNTDYYTILLKDDSDNLLRTFYLNKYSNYSNGIVTVELPALKENTNYKVEVVSFNSSSTTGVVSLSKEFKTKQALENSKECYLINLDNSSLIAINDVVLPSSIIYKADSLTFANLNTNLSVTKTPLGEGMIRLNIAKNSLPEEASYVPISVVLNEREEYTIPDLKQIGYDSTLSLLSDKPILSQESDTLIIDMKTPYLISPSTLYKVTKEGTFELIKKFNGNGSAKTFALADYPSLKDGDEVFCLF